MFAPELEMHKRIMHVIDVCCTEFCWICGEVHNNMHSFTTGTCTVLTTKDAVDKKNKANNGKRTLVANFMQFYQFYKSHEDSLRLEKTLQEEVCKPKKDELIDDGVAPADCAFLDQARVSLNECRQILMHTYSFAFYLAEDRHREVFLENQKDLHGNVELLSGCAIH